MVFIFVIQKQEEELIGGTEMKSLLMILSLFLLTSCHKESSEQINFDTSVLIGEWYSYNAGVVTDLTLTSSFLSGSVYKNVDSEITKYDDWSGYWMYSSSNSILSMNILHTATGHETSHHFKILSTNTYTISLRDQKLGSTDVYNKIVESKYLTIDAESNITYLKENSISAVEYRSSNSSIVEVDSSGHVIAHAQGIAFISISTNVGILIVKVVVN